jgi:hypothetical protein
MKRVKMTHYVFLVHGFSGFKKEFSLFTKYAPKNKQMVMFEYKEKYATISINVLAQRLLKQIISYEKSASSFSIVGFSQGGIISSLVMQQALQHQKLKKKMKKCICISSPFHGSFWAYLWPFIGAKQLRKSNPLLKQLREFIQQNASYFYLFYNPIDCFVPGRSSQISGIIQEPVYSFVHAHALRDKKMIKKIMTIV